MRKNPHGRILKWELKEQHLNTVPKSCSYININSIQEYNIILFRNMMRLRLCDIFCNFRLW